MAVKPIDPVDLFSMYMQVAGVPSLTDPPCEDPGLRGKRLGIINGATWITLWSNFFGRTILPGVTLINAGNEAVQLSFMRAHARGEPCPPQINIDLFARYARDLVDLYGVHAILISCSTMNRSYRAVETEMKSRGVPVIQIDEAMMERAVQTASAAPRSTGRRDAGRRNPDSRGAGRILIVAPHGPTVTSTRSPLEETAERLGQDVCFSGATVEQAFDLLGEGDILGHNDVIARAIREKQKEEPACVAVLAQLSMTVFKFTHPACEKEFGIPVLTSGETGFERAGEVLRRVKGRMRAGNQKPGS